MAAPITMRRWLLTTKAGAGYEFDGVQWKYDFGYNCSHGVIAATSEEDARDLAVCMP